VITPHYSGPGAYTGRVLIGEKPTDLPIMQAIKSESAINRQAADIRDEVPPSCSLAARR